MGCFTSVAMHSMKGRKGKKWAILILLVIHKCNAGWELHSRIHESDLPFQTAAKWVAIPVIHRLQNEVQIIKAILFLLFTSFPQAHQKNHSGFKKSNICNSSMYLHFNITAGILLFI